MSCCGKNREQLHQTNSSLPESQPESNAPVYFQYIGKTGLSVIGRRSHKRYRFDSPGVVVAVDPKDRNAFAAVPMLREVERPTDDSTGN